MALTKADEFRIDRIEQRENFLNMRLDQDKELGAIFERIADDITARIETEEDPDIIDAYRQATKDLHKHLEDNFTYYTSEFVKEGTRVEQLRMETMVKAADIEALTTAGINDIFVRINTDAVAAAWHNSKYGLNLSQRIWNTSENAKEAIGNIITTGVAAGDDVVDVARQLEAYILHGRSTAAELYPNMMKRMGDKRIPEEISYEALRLARTEMTRAFGDATLRAAREDPSAMGVQFELSSSHPVYDICDVHTAADDYGLGKGTYPLDAAPDYPFHPNCLCIMTIATEDTDAFIARLQAWAEDPDTQPDIEKWYNEYGENFGGSINSDATKAPDNDPKLQKLLDDINDMKDIDITQRKKFAKQLLKNLDLEGIPVSIKDIDPHGRCLINIKNNKTIITKYELSSKDLRNDNYKIKTAFHEAYHAKAHRLATDYLKNPNNWLDIEEVFAETSAHYLYKEFGLSGDIAPSYPAKLIEMLPRLKKLDKFKDCTTIEDFGKVAWEDRLNGVPAVWSKLYDSAMKINHSWTEYLGQYSEYIDNNKSDLLDTMIDDMPQHKKYRLSLSIDYDNALKKIKSGGSFSRNEETVAKNLLAIAMKRIGVK